MTNHNLYCIIVAAGSGSRFRSELPKQFCDLNGRPVLMHAVDCFRNTFPEMEIIVVLNEVHICLWRRLCEKHCFHSPVTVTGGGTRWASVKNAVGHIARGLDCDSIVMVHDGARPIVSRELLLRIAGESRDRQGVIPVVPVTDSLRTLAPDGTSSPVDRALFRAVQTPQAFNGALLAEAYRQPYRHDFTDDASVMAAAGYTDIGLVEGDPRNIKITLPDDLKIAALYL